MIQMELIRSMDLIQKKYREYFLPTVLIAIANSLAIIVDGNIVGNLLGNEALAAVNLCLPVMQLFESISILIGIGAGICIASAEGGWNKKKADSVYTTAVTYLAVIGCVLLTVQLLFAPNIARILAGTENLYSVLPAIKGAA